MVTWVRILVGVIVWWLANAVYLDFKRKGEYGVGRFLAFWAGQPTTWLTFFFVPARKTAPLGEPVDDEEALLGEIRRDRALRGPSEDDLD